MAADDQAIRARLAELSEKIGGVDSDRERLTMRSVRRMRLG